MYYPCSENKGADQLRGYSKADLRLCFRICKKNASDTKVVVQPQKMATGLRFRIKEVKALFCQSSKNKSTDQLWDYSTALFSHMQKSGFLMKRLKIESNSA